MEKTLNLSSMAPQKNKSCLIPALLFWHQSKFAHACFFLRTSCASSAFPVFPRLFEEDFRPMEV